MRFLLTALVLTLVCGSASANSFVELGGELLVPLPEDWVLASDSSELPAQFVYLEDGAEVLFFRSVMPKDDPITDELVLRATVDEIVDDVILGLPGGRVISSTGMMEPYRASFALEFLSLDSTHSTTLHHRLCGVLFLTSDGDQLLYTVWGRAAESFYPKVEASIQQMQAGLTYTGESERNVFALGQKPMWPMFLPLLLVFLLIVWFRRKRKNDRLPATDSDSRFWRCDCGRLNHNNSSSCRRCGQPNDMELSDTPS